ncbi:MAG: hypothetical protein L6455_17115, partial [Kiritimatiellae bacterium]|nr:hypothetical protein [Kiritimatiellia bacterium]
MKKQAWLADPMLMVHIQSCPANFDTQYFFQHLKRFRPTAIHFEAIWSNGALYESKLLPKVPGLG